MRNRWPKLILAVLLAAAPIVTAAASSPRSQSTVITPGESTAIGRSRCPCSSLDSPEVDAQLRARCVPICMTGDETIGTLP